MGHCGILKDPERMISFKGFLFVCLFIFRAAPAAHGSSQARG